MSSLYDIFGSDSDDDLREENMPTHPVVNNSSLMEKIQPDSTTVNEESPMEVELSANTVVKQIDEFLQCIPIPNDKNDLFSKYPLNPKELLPLANLREIKTQHDHHKQIKEFEEFYAEVTESMEESNLFAPIRCHQESVNVPQRQEYSPDFVSREVPVANYEDSLPIRWKLIPASIPYIPTPKENLKMRKELIKIVRNSQPSSDYYVEKTQEIPRSINNKSGPKYKPPTENRQKLSKEDEKPRTLCHPLSRKRFLKEINGKFYQVQTYSDGTYRCTQKEKISKKN